MTSFTDETAASSTLVDQSIRERALDIYHSFAVAAPAGSGKTGLLTRRVLKLLAVCDEPEQVLCITFTRKAAAEMQHRILAALERAQSTLPPEDNYQRQIWQNAKEVLLRDRQQRWQLLSAPHRLRILTIDGLCRYLAQQLAVESGLGDIPEPLDYADSCYRQAVHNLIAELDSNTAMGDDLALLLQHMDNDLPRLESLLVSFLGRRDQWLAHVLSTRDARQLLESYLCETINETLEDTAEQLQLINNELAALCDYAASNLLHLGDKEHPLCTLHGLKDLPPARAEQVSTWQIIADLLLTQAGDWRKTINKKSGFPTAKDARHPEQVEAFKERWQTLSHWCQEQPGLREKLLDVRHLPAPGFNHGQWQVLQALTHLLPRLAAELSLVFQQQHRCDFTEITLGALKALGNEDNPTDLSLRLDYQIRHILVDEFQDTASIQFQLLKKLVTGWAPGDGRTLFLVGDGMQSLYGFRNANVGLFLEAREQPVNQVVLEPLDISVNFRSDAGIVNWVNQIFPQVFPATADISRGAVPYAPAVAARPATSDRPVEIHSFPPNATDSEEAQRVATLVRDAHQNSPEGSVAILARKRGQLTAILEEFQQQGIQWQATAIDPLSSRMPVIDLISLTRALINPADRIAWLSVLRAPWCGLTLYDLHALANTALDNNPTAPGQHFPWLPGQVFDPSVNSALSPEGRLSLARTCTILQAALQDRGRKPLRSWIEGAWLALGGPAALGSNPAASTWCQQYFDLLEQHANGDSIRDREAFEYAANNLYASAESTAKNPVHIMTIHKAKGLEFDTVIVPGLDQKGAGNNAELLYWRERLSRHGEPQLLISPPQATGDDTDPLIVHLKREAKLKSELEDARVLYVACTRAIKKLHLLYRQPEKDPVSGSLLKCLWPALKSEHKTQEPSPKVEREDMPDRENATLPVMTSLSRLKPGWQFPDSLPNGPAQKMDTRPVDEETSRQARDTQAAGLGTVLHRTLRQIVIEGAENWDQARQARQKAVWKLQLQQLGLAVSEQDLKNLSSAVTNTLNDPKGRWLLDSRHPDSACELTLGAPGVGGSPRTWIIDRTFIFENTRWIIDYKMAAPDADQPLSDFLQQQREQYRPQLENYARLLAFQDDLSPDHIAVTMALYFPLIPHLEIY